MQCESSNHKSHVFSETERKAYRERAQFEGASELLYKEVTTISKERSKAERQLKKQQPHAA